MSPNANIMNADDIITDCQDASSNNKARESLPSLKTFKSNPKEPDELQIGNITPGDGSVIGGKIVVSVEDHQAPSEESHRRKLERNISQEKCDVSAKKTHTDEDLNLISNYDSDNTWSKENAKQLADTKSATVICNRYTETTRENANKGEEKYKHFTKKDIVSRLTGRNSEHVTSELKITTEQEHNNFTSNIRKVVCCLNASGRRCS